MTCDRSKAGIRTRIEARARGDGAAARPWIAAFVGLIADGVRVSDAAARLGVARSTLYAARIADPRFAPRWDAAARAARPVVSHPAAIAALFEGEAVPVFYRGRQIGERRVYPKGSTIVRRLRNAAKTAAMRGNGSSPAEHGSTQFRADDGST